MAQVEISSSVPDAVVAVATGALLFTTTVPTDRGVVVDGGVVEQTKACLSALEAVLADRDASLDAVVRLTVYVAEHLQADLLVAEDAVLEAFDGPVPPLSVVGVARLRLDDQLVEFEAVAAL